MTVLYPWLFLAIILALVIGIFLLPAMRRRPAGKREFETGDRPLFREESSEELGMPISDPAANTCSPPVPELPRNYGVDRMVLIARDPHWLFAYWEVTAAKQDEFTSSYGTASWSFTHPVLRVYDVTGIDFNGANAKGYTDLSVNEQVDNWHIKVGEPDRSFCVDLGRMFPDGRFATLLRSNIVTTPRASLSDRLDEEWMWIEGLYSSISQIQYGTSSLLIIEEMALKKGIKPLGVSSPGNWNTSEN